MKMQVSKLFFAAWLNLVTLACAHRPHPAESEAAGVAPMAAESAPILSSSPEAVSLPSPPPEKSPPVPNRNEDSTRTWTVKAGRVSGVWPKALLVAKFKNKKLPGFTSDICYNYGGFSVVETKSTGEVGSAEIVVRHEAKLSCSSSYKGRYSNLKIIEGHFAGVAGDYVVVDGDDKTEGVVDFQMFEVGTGKEAYKGRRNPSEELLIQKRNGVTSIEFFGRLKVMCELASDGEPCWKKVLAQNGVKAKVAMPNCKKAFGAAKVSLFEPALVTVRMRVADLKMPVSEVIAGRATCVPAPP